MVEMDGVTLIPEGEHRCFFPSEQNDDRGTVYFYGPCEECGKTPLQYFADEGWVSYDE